MVDLRARKSVPFLQTARSQENGAYDHLAALATAAVYLRPEIARISGKTARGEPESGETGIFNGLLNFSQKIIQLGLALPSALPLERVALLIKSLRESPSKLPNGADKSFINAAISILTAPAQ